MNVLECWFTNGQIAIHEISFHYMRELSKTGLSGRGPTQNERITAPCVSNESVANSW